MKLTHTAGAIAAAATLVLAPAVAHADTDVHTDFTGDVVSTSFSSNTEEWTPEPTRTEGDIVSTRVSHLDRKVRIKIKLAALSRTGRGWDFYYVLRTNIGKRYLDLDATRGRWAGKPRLTNANDKTVSCTGLSRSIDYVNDAVLVVIPRSCLGNPRWVRVGIGSIGLGSTKVFVDDARTQGNIYNLPVLGPRVYR